MDTDTIFALSSGPPPAGIAVVRLSGPGARVVLESLAGGVPEPRHATLRVLRDAAGVEIDRGLIFWFPAPKSFTGEDVAELHLHGGRAVVAAVLDALARLPGFRPAEPGEFSRRAFLNRRMDLTEVEGLADLIAAETEAQRRQALRQAEGGLRALYDGWRERLIKARALLEAELDFADEDDVPGSVSDRAWADVGAVGDAIAGHLDDGHRGERVRDGAEILVLGAPNVGKSSLINALARRDVAIVAAEPGTTRDLIEVRLDLAGYAVTLIDTAGLREACGAVEREGIRRAEARAESADLVLWLAEAGAMSPMPRRKPDGPPLWRLGTKADLIAGTDRDQVADRFDLTISAKTGEGVADLIGRLAGFVAESFDPGESVLITRARYRAALAGCHQSLTTALTDPGKALELRAEDLRQATDALGRITGRVGVEDLLDVIFRDFCIGK